MAEKIPAAVVPPSAVPPPAVMVQRRSSLSMVALVAVLAVGGGGVAVWYMQQHDPTDTSGESTSEKPPATVVHLDGFTVNLADPEENHFLRVTIDLALARMPAPVDREKPNSGLPMEQMRDSILSVLTACKADALLTPEGKLQLKKTLLDALNRDIPELGVREIYFTEFLVQR